MQKTLKVRVVLIGLAAVVIAILSVIAYKRFDLLAERVIVAEKELSTTRDELLGYVKYTDYIAPGKKSLEGQTKLLAATLRQPVKWVEHIERKFLIGKSSATVLLDLGIEYSFGYDLAPGKYDISNTANGLVITVGKPIPVAKTSVSLRNWEILDGGVFVDEKAAALDLITRIQPVFDQEAKRVAQSESVMALCEKRLIEHLTVFLERQPGVKFVPKIVVAYK
ncbi:MAG: hypothetical protein Q7J42_06495 [Sulfuritalea sp.]|nr:hypothetical protein [Sulfuritalea sp.]